MPTFALARHQPRLLALITLVVAMMLTVAASLWLVAKQTRDLARPNLHGELWQAYQVHMEMERVTLSARQLLDGMLEADELVVRIQVLRSMTQRLEGQHLFDFLPQARPAAEATLQRIIALSRDWDEHARWGDWQAARIIAEEALLHLPPLQKPMHEIMVATNISLANERDEERQHLHDYFIGLGWALLGLLLGSSLLAMRLIGNYREARELSRRLVDMNQSLEQRVAERTAELAEGQALLRRILDASPSDVALISLDEQQVHFVNRRLLQRLELNSASDFSLTKLFTNSRDGTHFREALRARHRVDDWESQLSAREPYWGVVSGRLMEYGGAPAQLIWSYDISLRKRMEQRLMVLATTDALTGLSNRHDFMQRAGELLKNAERFDQPFTLLMIDVDHFKQINDRHGHQAGDQVLARLGQLLRQELREVDIIGRLGGEEFAALLTQTDQHPAMQVAERLRLSTQSLTLSSGKGTLNVTLSIGLATRHAAEPLEGVLARADAALYEAKAAGRNRIARAMQ